MIGAEAGYGKFDQRFADAVTLEKRVGIQLDDLRAVHLDKALYDPVVKDIKIFENLSLAEAAVDHGEHLQFTEGILCVPEDRIIVDAVVEDEDLGNAG